jgi:ubiquitin C-terminal hydrolase
MNSIMNKLFKIPHKESTKQQLKDNGICGLQNMGNTCYINSVIQCIRYDGYLFEYYKDEYHKRHLNKTSEIDIAFTNAWRQLLLDFWNNNRRIIQPVGFFGIFQKMCHIKNKTELIGFNHNDAEEFLQFFLESLHDGIKIKIPADKITIKGDVQTIQDKLVREFCEFYKTHFERNGISPIMRQYEGVYCSSITNSVDDRTSNRFEPYVYINLEIDGLNENESITKALESFTEPEELSGYKDEDHPYPEDTKFHKQVRFMKLPHNLIIVLKRFKFNMQTLKPYKIKTAVQFPTTLDMSPFYIGYDAPQKYELYSISNHKGGLDRGHYYSFVKNFDNNWILYNDQNFKEVASDTMDRKNLFSNDAYILFYRRK